MTLDLDEDEDEEDDEDFELPETLTEFLALMGFVINENKVYISIFEADILKELIKLIEFWNSWEEYILEERDKELVIH